MVRFKLSFKDGDLSFDADISLADLLVKISSNKYIELTDKVGVRTEIIDLVEVVDNG